jgi:hypothetical protein
MKTDDLLPPRKKNWTTGRAQVGLFIRTEEGHVIQYVHDNCSPEVALQLQQLALTALDVKLSCAHCGKALDGHTAEELKACTSKVVAARVRP